MASIASHISERLAALLAAVGLPAWAVAELHAHGKPTVLAQQLFSNIGSPRTTGRPCAEPNLFWPNDS